MRESVQFLMNGSSQRRYEWNTTAPTTTTRDFQQTKLPTNPSPFLTYAKILKVNKPTTRFVDKLSSKTFLICFKNQFVENKEEGNLPIIWRIFDICDKLPCPNQPRQSAGKDGRTIAGIV